MAPSPEPPGPIRLVSPLLGLLLGWVAAWQGRRVLDAAEQAWGAGQAADALPLYLAARVAAEGGDPTSAEALQQVFHEAGLAVHAQVWSTLYPASAAVLLQPLAGGGWGAFLATWRPLVLLLFALGGAAVGAASAGRRHLVLGGGLGAWLATCAWPLLVPAVGLGQANLAVAGLAGLAIAALAAARGGLAGVLAVLGAGLKLVPAILLWPLLARARAGSLAAAAVTLLALAGLTATFVPLGLLVEGVSRTVAFQGSVRPAWAVHPEAAAFLVHAFAAVRHLPLLGLSLVFTGIACRAAPAPAVLAGAGALLLAWLGLDAAGVGAFYLHLAMPAAAWLLAWPLRPAAPRRAWLIAPVALLPWVCAPADPYLPSAELRLSLVGLALWMGVAARLSHGLVLPRTWRRLLAGAAALVLFYAAGSALDRTMLRPLPPPPPDGDRQEIRPEQRPGVGTPRPEPAVLGAAG